MAQENFTPGNLSAADYASAFITHLTDLNNALLTIWMLTQKQQKEKETLKANCN